MTHKVHIDNIEEHIRKFSHWIMKEGEQHFKGVKKPAKEAQKGLIEIVNELEAAIPVFAHNLIHQPKQNHHLAEKFIRKGKKLLRHLDETILQSSPKIDLKPLQETLSSAIKMVTQAFKDILKKVPDLNIFRHVKEMSKKAYIPPGTPRHLTIPRKKTK